MNLGASIFVKVSSFFSFIRRGIRKQVAKFVNFLGGNKEAFTLKEIKHLVYFLVDLEEKKKASDNRFSVGDLEGIVKSLIVSSNDNGSDKDNYYKKLFGKALFSKNFKEDKEKDTTESFTTESFTEKEIDEYIKFLKSLLFRLLKVKDSKENNTWSYYLCPKLEDINLEIARLEGLMVDEKFKLISESDLNECFEIMGNGLEEGKLSYYKVANFIYNCSLEEEKFLSLGSALSQDQEFEDKIKNLIKGSNPAYYREAESSGNSKNLIEKVKLFVMEKIYTYLSEEKLDKLIKSLENENCANEFPLYDLNNVDFSKNSIHKRRDPSLSEINFQILENYFQCVIDKLIREKKQHDQSFLLQETSNNNKIFYLIVKSLLKESMEYIGSFEKIDKKETAVELENSHDQNVIFYDVPIQEDILKKEGADEELDGTGIRKKVESARTTDAGNSTTRSNKIADKVIAFSTHKYSAFKSGFLRRISNKNSGDISR